MSIAHVVEPDEIIGDDDQSRFESQVPDTQRHVGALPQVEVGNDQQTKPNDLCCPGCGRPPGPVAVPGVSLFDLGIKHCLNRLVKLIMLTGCSEGEAKAVVFKLQSRDVEL